MNRIVRSRDLVQNNRCYTVKGLQEILGVSRLAIYELLHQNVFRSFIIARKYRIPKKSFEAWMEGKDDVTVHGSAETIVKSAEIYNVDMCIRKEEQMRKWITHPALLFSSSSFVLENLFVDIFLPHELIPARMKIFIHTKSFFSQSYPSSFFPARNSAHSRFSGLPVILFPLGKGGMAMDEASMRRLIADQKNTIDNYEKITQLQAQMIKLQNEQVKEMDKMLSHLNDMLTEALSTFPGQDDN